MERDNGDKNMTLQILKSIIRRIDYFKVTWGLMLVYILATIPIIYGKSIWVMGEYLEWYAILGGLLVTLVGVPVFTLIIYTIGKLIYRLVR